MSNEEIKKEMVEIGDGKGFYDVEIWHEEADKLLIKILRDLGYNELCDWWENGKKWYA